MLKMINEIHKLCLAQVWEACSNCSVEYHDQFCLVCSSNILYFEDVEFIRGCKMHHLGKGQGLVGQAYLSRKPCFCRDITQLNSDRYPLVHYARHAGLAESFAICFHDTYSNNCYILELFFKVGDCEDPQYLLGSLMKTLKKFPKFKVAFTEELADQELYVEVIQPPMQTSQTIESPQMPRTPWNGGDKSLSTSSNQQLIVEVEDVSSGREVVVVVDDDAKERNSTPSRLQDARTDIPINCETLKQHFGRKLKDVAESLGVSRSTLKRICRQQGIPRWKPHKRNRLTHHLQPKQDHPIPHLPPYTAMQDGRSSVTIKADYRNNFLKFELPFASGMVELAEQLSKRLKLSIATCSITYLDEEGDSILKACDEDLQNYMSTCRSRGLTTIKISVLPITT